LPLAGRRALQVERQQAAEDFVVGHFRGVVGPVVGGGDGLVEFLMRQIQPGGAGVVEVVQGALLQFRFMAGQIVAENIAAAARRLNELRENWLNPAEWVDWVITPEEEKAGFPRRPVAKPGHEAELKKRTLTNLYNARPTWLNLAHQALDKAVAAAYDWFDYTPETPDDEILRRLLALNLQRATA